MSKLFSLPCLVSALVSAFSSTEASVVHDGYHDLDEKSVRASAMYEGASTEAKFTITPYTGKGPV